MPLKIHFLNVGHGDCTIVEHPSGRLSMVDINNGKLLDEGSSKELFGSEYVSYEAGRLAQALLGHPLSDRNLSLAEFATKKYDIELANPIDYFTANFRDPFGNIRPLWRFVSTHPDTDHLCGLECLSPSGIEIQNFWDTSNTKVIDSFKSSAEKAAWESYQEYRKDGAGHRVLRLQRDAKGPLYNQNESGADGGDGIFILAPTAELAASAESQKCWNLHSYVLALNYAGKLVILGGDADEEAWNSIHDYYGENLKCSVLKASHHGRDSGYYQPAVKDMSPDYTIVSVGKKPSTDASTKYGQYSGKVMSTRWYGNIVVEISEWGTVTVTPQKDRDKEAVASLLSLFGQVPTRR